MKTTAGSVRETSSPARSAGLSTAGPDVATSGRPSPAGAIPGRGRFPSPGGAGPNRGGGGPFPGGRPGEQQVRGELFSGAGAGEDDVELGHQVGLAAELGEGAGAQRVVAAGRRAHHAALRAVMARRMRMRSSLMPSPARTSRVALA